MQGLGYPMVDIFVRLVNKIEMLVGYVVGHLEVSGEYVLVGVEDVHLFVTEG